MYRVTLVSSQCYCETEKSNSLVQCCQVLKSADNAVKWPRPCPLFSAFHVTAVAGWLITLTVDCVVECSSYRGGSRGGYRPGPQSYGGGGEGNADRLVDQLQELVGVLA